jgi:DNA-binding NarL/FixJ family response regulator
MGPSSQATAATRGNAHLIRVLVASDHEAMTDRLRAGLSEAPKLLVLGPSAIPMRALLGTLRIYQPDVLLLGQKTLKQMGERAIEQLVELPCQPRVLLLCERPESRFAATVLKYRFYGYVGYADNIATLLNAVRCASRGELWIPRLALTEALYGRWRTRAAHERFE